MPDRGAGQGDDPLRVQLAVGKKPSDFHHVLEVQMPDQAIPVHRVEVVNVESDSARRMGPSELFPAKLGVGRNGEPASLTLANEDRPLGQPGHGPQSPIEGIFLSLQRQAGRGRVGVAVHGGDEDRPRGFGRVGHLAEGPSPQSRPEAGFEQQLLDFVPGEGAGVSPGIGAEADAVGAAAQLGGVQLNDQRLKGPPLSPVDGRHPARARRGVSNPGGLLVLEQELAAMNLVPDLHVHGRAHARVVGGQQSHLVRRRGCFNPVLGLPGDWKIQTFAVPVKHATYGRDHRRV